MGQLGDGTNTDRPLPGQTGIADDWVAVAASSYNLAINKKGELWAWGNNTNGQLGNGTTTHLNIPTRVEGDGKHNWVTVAAGSGHSLGIRGEGELWAWGRNSLGSIGDDTTTQRPTPVRIGTAGDWVAVAAGDNHSLAINKKGELWAWGYNYYGQIGDGSGVTRRIPTRVGTDSDWLMVTSGTSKSMGLREAEGRRELWSWGRGVYGALGNGSTANSRYPTKVIGDNWITVLLGSNHGMAIRQDEGKLELWGWGLNGNGQIGDGYKTNRLSPVQIPGENWIAVSAGIYHSLGMREINGKRALWAWGSNNFGQLGDGTTTQRLNPVQVIGK